MAAPHVADTPTSELDGDLVAQCLAGDCDQFRHLVRRYERVVVAHLRSRLRDPASLEDAAQETFVRAYQNLGTLRSHERFYSWLIGIADRVARESGRRVWRQHHLLDAYAAELRRPGPARLDHDVPLESAVASLSGPLQEVVLLRFYGSRSCAEIAELLQIPVSTVTKRLSRAYDQLRRRLSR
jgi:RNA polymerase sigma-70 factor (ECF subfamily)